MPNLNDYLAAERIKCKTPYGKTNTKGNLMKQKWTEYVVTYIRKDLKRLHIEKPVRLHYTFYEPNCKRDLDNIASFAMKIIQDSLVKSHIISNDGWKNIIGFECEFFVSNHQPRIEVTLEEMWMED